MGGFVNNAYKALKIRNDINAACKGKFFKRIMNRKIGKFASKFRFNR